jgi:hypothetical protein
MSSDYNNSPSDEEKNGEFNPSNKNGYEERETTMRAMLARMLIRMNFIRVRG